MGGDIAAWCVCAACRRVCRISTRQLKKALARAKGLFKKQLRGKAAIDAAVARLIADPKGATSMPTW